VKRLATQETAVQSDGSRVTRFFREVKSEMKKVSWPNKKELISYTGVVFVAVVFVSILIWFCDTAFAKMLEVILR
jgi:preprotein translocase subunit SecE